MARRQGDHAIPVDVRRRVRERYLNCFYCGDPGVRPRHSWATFWKLEVDHIVPIHGGGTSDESNLVMACPTCNRAKGAKNVAEFAWWLQRFHWKIAS